MDTKAPENYWQPIDTVPNDDTKVILAFAWVIYEDHPKEWMIYDGHPTKPPERICWECVCACGSDVHDDVYFDECDAYGYADPKYKASQFTHWRPVGEFPKIIE